MQDLIMGICHFLTIITLQVTLTGLLEITVTWELTIMVILDFMDLMHLDLQDLMLLLTCVLMDVEMQAHIVMEVVTSTWISQAITLVRIAPLHLIL